uniref:Uncharacterized protein LOC111104889 n=1 Tax=Crassostrea virginica TaxID=6565 RepID=A0A8B8AUK5_CRAVI|nr:uncharacterized protein LOC111104889 [Crassostrea virginica]
MLRDAENFVSTCGPCSRNKRPQRHGRAEIFKYHSGSPMERVHLDFLGPLPRTARGNEYVLVMVDQFTKWVECIPCPPRQRRLPLRQQSMSSSLVSDALSRFSRTRGGISRCYVDKAQNCWNEHLSQIAGALRSTVNRNSGFTANRLMVGREVNTPADLLYLASKQGDTVDLEAYVMDLEQALQTAHETARGQFSTSEERMKRGYDLKVHSRAYKEGDLAYILYTATTVKGKCRKLSPSRKGSGIVIKNHSPYLYRVKTKAAVMVAIHDRLMKCVDRDIPLWLSRYIEKVQSPIPKGEAIPVSPAKAGGEPPPSSSDSPVSSPTPGTPKAAPRPKRKRAVLGRSQDPLVLSLSSLNPPSILMCIAF